jgi:hypothetical protein
MRRLETARSPTCAVSAALLISLAWIGIAHAKDCPRKRTLGTSRILKVDAVSFPQVGSKNFPQTLPLRDHEVVLTFDDGPWPPTTPKVLAALARECARDLFRNRQAGYRTPHDGPADLRRRSYHRTPHLDAF